MKRKYVCIWAVALLVLNLCLVAYGMESGQGFFGDAGEVVFLFDTSGSMDTQDAGRLAADAIRQAAYSLPSGYRAGFVAYGTQIQTAAPLSPDMGQIEAGLAAIQYSGYTNAGEGLNQAVGLFSGDPGVERHIIMLSDGEIDMPDSQTREGSRALYAQAAERARDKGIKICIIAVGSELNNPGLHIFDGAELTDGAIYWEGQSGSLSQIMGRILSDRLGLPREGVSVTGPGTNGGGIDVPVPAGAKHMKVLVTGEAGLEAVAADYRAENGRVITGKRFAIVDMERPEAGQVKVRFETADWDGVRASVLTEFTAFPRLAATYRVEEMPRTAEEIKKNVPPQYGHYADITVELADSGGSGGNLWDGALEGHKIPYTLNGQPYDGTIKGGQIQATIPADGVDMVEVSLGASGLGGICHIEQPATARLVKTPDPVFVPVPDYRPLWAIIGVLAAVALGLVAWAIKKGQGTVIYMAPPGATSGPPKKVETKACEYTGKFNLYMVRTPDGRDIPPQEFRLFGRKNGRMALDWLLDSCKVKVGRVGAEDIVFYPGPEKSVLVMDQSEKCMVMRGAEILKKGMGYPVYYNEKLTVAFEDEATELEIHYKALKPSERDG